MLVFQQPGRHGIIDQKRGLSSVKRAAHTPYPLCEHRLGGDTVRDSTLIPGRNHPPGIDRKAGIVQTLDHRSSSGEQGL
jgi:hypothetical protein